MTRCAALSSRGADRVTQFGRDDRPTDEYQSGVLTMARIVHEPVREAWLPISIVFLFALAPALRRPKEPERAATPVAPAAP